jgi:hypothetical protein
MTGPIDLPPTEEVTPEMAAAGGKVIFENPSLCEHGWDELAVMVYRAMEQARLMAEGGEDDLLEAQLDLAWKLVQQYRAEIGDRSDRMAEGFCQGLWFQENFQALDHSIRCGALPYPIGEAYE